MRISDWSSDVCSSDLPLTLPCIEINLLERAGAGGGVTAGSAARQRNSARIAAIEHTLAQLLAVLACCRTLLRTKVDLQQRIAFRIEQRRTHGTGQVGKGQACDRCPGFNRSPGGDRKSTRLNSSH